MMQFNFLCEVVLQFSENTHKLIDSSYTQILFQHPQSDI